MQTVKQIDAEIQIITTHNASSEWLKWALRTALTRDPIGVANDAEVLFAILTARMNAIIESHEYTPPKAKEAAPEQFTEIPA